MSIPQFTLTKKIPLTIYRREAGDYVNGRWVEGALVPIIREVNIQPLKPAEILMLPEADRTRESYKLYCAEDLREQLEGPNGYDSDEFDWQGGRYKVMKRLNFAMGTLDHWKVIASRIGPTPN
jgi:hypothetical protein